MGADATRFWEGAIEAYDLRVDKVRILKDICREIDLIERIERELKGAPTMVTGSMGQQIANPLFGEARQHRATLATLIKSLNLDGLKSNTASASGRSRRDNVIDMANKWKQAK